MTTIVKILTGHTSPETAFLIEDYPYGRKVRTQKRVWIEEKPKKGFRLMEQTKNPTTGLWNKPAAGTYADFGMAMFLDEKGYVQHVAVGPYTPDEEIVSFIRTFGITPTLKAVIVAKLKWEMIVARSHAEGLSPMTINGATRPAGPVEIAEHEEKLRLWTEVAKDYGILK